MFMYKGNRKYRWQLGWDLAVYGNCYEELVKYNWISRLIRRIQGLPTDRKYVNPLNIRL